MIGHIDAVDAVVAGDDCVIRGLDPLDDERQLAPLPEPERRFSAKFVRILDPCSEHE